jgi:hypothetical protein
MARIIYRLLNTHAIMVLECWIDLPNTNSVFVYVDVPLVRKWLAQVALAVPASAGHLRKLEEESQLLGTRLTAFHIVS